MLASHWVRSFFALSFLLISFISQSQAQFGDLVTQYPMRAMKFVEDYQRNFIYATLADIQAVAVIDNNTDTLVTTIPVNFGQPFEMAMSLDGNELFVASRMSAVMAVIDLNTMTVARTIPLPRRINDIVIGHNNMLYATPAETPNSGILQIDALAGVVLNVFDGFGNVQVHRNGTLEISPDRNRLYFGNSLITPAMMASFDISNDQFAPGIMPNLMQLNIVSNTGVGGVDMAMTLDGQFISLPIWGAPGISQVSKMTTPDFISVGNFQTTDDVREIAFNPENTLAFMVQTPVQIDVYDMNSYQQVYSIPVTSEALELHVDGSGSKLYVSVGGFIQVFSAVNYSMPITGMSFPDPALQACFDEQIQTNNWQYMEEVTRFTCSGRGVVDIAGIQAFPRLRDLDLSNNAIFDLNPLRAMPALRTLRINKNAITDAYPLQDLPALQGLHIGDNPLDVYSLHPAINNMRGLTSLGLAGLPIQDIAMLPLYDPQTGQPYDIQELDLARTDYQFTGYLTQFQNLRILNLADNPQLDIQPLTSMQSLQQLNLANNDKIDIYLLQQVIAGNHGLTHLNLNSIEIFDIGMLPLFNPQLGQPYNLRELRLANTGLTNAQQLDQFSNLEVLDLSGNNIPNLIPLNNLRVLKELDISGNTRVQLYDLVMVLNNNPQLEVLGLADIKIGKIQDLPLFNPAIGQPLNIRSLNLRNSNLRDLWGIDVLVNLEILDVSENNITDVNQLQLLTRLRELDLSGNAGITNLIPVLDNKPNLQKLGLADIYVEDLNMLPLFSWQTGRPYNLTSLNLRNTGIKDIYRLGEFMQLEELDVSYNQITDVIPISGMYNLRKLDLSGNLGLSEQHIHPVLDMKPRLTHLGLAGIRIPDLYFLPLYDYQNNRPYPLVELNLSGTGIELVDRLPEFPGLKSVNLSHNRISDLFPLGMMMQLRELDLSHNRIADVTPLMNGLSGLRKLDVSGNTQINPNEIMVVIAQNKHLTELGLSFININNIGQLPIFNGPAGQPYALRSLKLAATGLFEIYALGQFPLLEELDVSYNLLSDVSPLGALAKLRSLSLKNVNANNLNGVENLRQLKIFDVSGNAQLDVGQVALVVQNNPMLRELGINGIPLIDLGMLNLFDNEVGRPYTLTRLDVSATGLINLNQLSDFYALQSLDISKNQINDLYPIQNLMRLKVVNIGYNNNLNTLMGLDSLTRLESLTVSGLTQQYVINELNIVMVRNPHLRFYIATDMGLNNLYDLPMPQPAYSTQDPGLLVLDISRNPFMDINRLTQYQGLRALIMQNVTTQELSPLYNMYSLELLDLTDNDQFYCIDLNNLQNALPQTQVLRPVSCRLNAVPNLTLIAPTEGSVYVSNTGVPMSATAIDTEDGDLSTQIRWTSSLDGYLGTASGFIPLLTAGDHLITASVTDSRGATSSKSVNITVKAVVLSYCTSKGNSTYYEWANSITLLNQTITTGNNNGYVDRTDVVFPLTRGGSYPLTMNPGFRSSSYNEYWRVWIDFNQDGSFGADEQIYSGGSRTTLVGNLLVPITAKAGKTRMRIAMRYGSYPSSCGNYTWGETEDYTVDLQ